LLFANLNASPDILEPFRDEFMQKAAYKRDVRSVAVRLRYFDFSSSLRGTPSLTYQICSIASVIQRVLGMGKESSASTRGVRPRWSVLLASVHGIAISSTALFMSTIAPDLFGRFL
jgi:hypothetical protein